MVIMDPHIVRRSLRIIVKLRDLLALTPRNPEEVEEAVVIVRSVVEAAVIKVVVVGHDLQCFKFPTKAVQNRGQI